MCKDIYILGGGASGLFAAIQTARCAMERNHTIHIHIIEANDKLGKKILSTGNGHCNITNTRDLRDKYHAEDMDFVHNVFQAFSNVHIIQAFQNMGVLLTDKNGYLYPGSMQAATVTETLVSYCQLLGVNLITNTITDSVTYNPKTQKFHIITHSRSDSADCSVNEKHTYIGDKVLIACGTKAGIKADYSEELLGSVNTMGHRVRSFLPALCSVYIDKKYKEFFKNTNGVRSEITASLQIEDTITESFSGELQLTDYGLSGIVIYQLSSPAAKALYDHKQTAVIIDFLPQYTASELYDFISAQLFFHKKSLLDILSNLLNKKLSNALISRYSTTTGNTVKAFSKSLSKETLLNIFDFIKHVSFPVAAVNDYLHAQICSGGISLKDIDYHTMESKIIKGLYFSGECLDVDGICGGYNLQWAWSTGYIAGRSMADD